MDYSPWGRKESDMAEHAILGESSCSPSSLWQPWKISSLDLKISNPKTKAQYEEVFFLTSLAPTEFGYLSQDVYHLEFTGVLIKNLKESPEAV